MIGWRSQEISWDQRRSRNDSIFAFMCGDVIHDVMLRNGPAEWNLLCDSQVVKCAIGFFFSKGMTREILAEIFQSWSACHRWYWNGERWTDAVRACPCEVGLSCTRALHNHKSFADTCVVREFHSNCCLKLHPRWQRELKYVLDFSTRRL